MGSDVGGSTARPPAEAPVMRAPTNRPKSSEGQVVKRPARRESAASRTGQRRSGRSSLLTIGARCCVISTDCIQNVDDSQPQVPGGLPEEATGKYARGASRLRPAAAPGVELAGHREGAPPVIRIGVAAWRVGRGPQPAASRRTIAATSPRGTPTGQAADAASSSGETPDKSEPASPSLA